MIAPDVPSETAYFLESGLASVVATNSDDESVEVGHVGYVGMAGAHVLLKVNETPNRTFMQAGGTEFRCRYPCFFPWQSGFRRPTTCFSDMRIAAICSLPIPPCQCPLQHA